ncbi:LpxL/LpxP family acyltransferase [Rheinheimera nanhaiensis]|uniref:Acetyltransferase n=1 Tax=Rheinheimera nanhaiensis E407-8 TaxID=562729 RepID=I1E0N6_9GAMM|nr:acetyltransferase [Rheinheimera nanhaiensis]GAB59864.1 acetyltransferase [Rheinheimera nanhaiensis E407-8]
MTTAQRSHWAQKRENGSYLAIRLLLGLYRFGGKYLILLVMVPVLGYFFIKDRSARTASRQFLQQVHTFKGPLSPFQRPPGYWQSYRHFWQFAMAALAKIDAWLGRLDGKQVYYGGSVGFDTIMQHDTGAVLIGSHLGNLEVCRALVRSKYPVKINVLAHTRHAAAFNRILKDSNSAVDLQLIEVTELTPAVGVMLSDCIARGELVVIVGDRISVQAPERAIWADFLGKPAPFAIGPWVLASILQCPVYLMFCMRQDNGYNLMFEPFAGQLKLPRKDRQQALQNAVQQYAQQLEQVACRYPLQWFNFYDFWQLPAASQHKLSQQKEAPGDSST